MSSINDPALRTTLETCPEGDGMMVECTCDPRKTWVLISVLIELAIEGGS
jgi:hypothetical protein